MAAVNRGLTSFPFSKKSTVGDPFTPSSVASSRFCWRNTFTNSTSSRNSPATASYLGASASQGGHSLE